MTRHLTITSLRHESAQGFGAPTQIPAIRYLINEVRGGGDLDMAVSVLAASYVEDGQPLDVLYEHLDQLIVSGEAPGMDERTVRLAGMAWAEGFVGRFNRLTCAEPMTGLASAEHLADVLVSLFRQSAEPDLRHLVDDLSLLIVDMKSRADDRFGGAAFGQALRMAQVADSIDGWFTSTPLAVAMLGPDRVAVLIPGHEPDADIADGFATHLAGRFNLSPSKPSVRVLAVPVPGELCAALALVEALKNNARE